MDCELKIKERGTHMSQERADRGQEPGGEAGGNME